MGRSDFRASETEARQQEAAASKAHTAAQPLAIMMNIADQKPHSYFSTSIDRLSHNCDSEDNTLLTDPLLTTNCSFREARSTLTRIYAI